MQSVKTVNPFIFVILALCSFALPLYYFQWSLQNDWDWFNTTSWLTHSNVWSYHRFPLHDPWGCGGQDLLANPQTRIFSPMVFLDIFLPPHLANLVSLVIYSFGGLMGMFLLLRQLDTSIWTSLVMSWVFICSSWFSLHFIEGHIVYGSMQLLPLILYLFLNAQDFNKRALFFLYLTLFLLDGAIYTFIFSLYLVLASLLINLDNSRRKWMSVLKTEPLSLVLLIMASALLSCGKLLPLLLMTPPRPPSLETTIMAPELIFRSLFNPFPLHRETVQRFGFPYGFHECSFYLGLIAVLVVVIFKIRFWRVHWGKTLAVAAFFWIAVGSLPQVNPWRLHQILPLFNRAHVQSRISLLAFIFFLILLAQAVDWLGKSKWGAKIAIGLLLFFVMEAGWVRFYPYWDAYQIQRQRPIKGLIISQNLERTYPVSDRPIHYLTLGAGAEACYDPWAAPVTRAYTSSDYRGEIYFLESSSGDGAKVELRSFTPGQLIFNYQSARQASIEINNANLFGWKVTDGEARVLSRPDELLRIEVPASESPREVWLVYSPSYFPWLVIAMIVGVGLWFFLFWKGKERFSGQETHKTH